MGFHVFGAIKDTRPPAGLSDLLPFPAWAPRKDHSLPRCMGACQGFFTILDLLLRRARVFLASFFFTLEKWVQESRKRNALPPAFLLTFDSFPRCPGTENTGVRAPLMERQQTDAASFLGLIYYGQSGAVGLSLVISGESLWSALSKASVLEEEVEGWLLPHIWPPSPLLSGDEVTFL